MVYVMGVPSVDHVNVDRSRYALTLVEVGKCANLRLNANREGKMSKHALLSTKLCKLWKVVALVVVPIGRADTTLE
eukprot:scaffold320561_cov32-Prasinocladus_malaysianus.AAC.1